MMQKPAKAAPKAAKKVEKKIEKKPDLLEKPEIGVENLKEATEAMFYVCRILMVEFKDGVDWNDVPMALGKLALDHKFRNHMAMAWSGREKLSEEVKDLSVPEAVDLGRIAFNEMMAIVNLMKETKK